MVKRLPANSGDMSSNPRWPWRKKWQPSPIFLLGNPMDRAAWRATVYGVAKESDMTE